MRRVETLQNILFDFFHLISLHLVKLNVKEIVTFFRQSSNILYRGVM
jgi:hypothetical protein